MADLKFSCLKGPFREPWSLAVQRFAIFEYFLHLKSQFHKLMNTLTSWSDTRWNYPIWCSTCPCICWGQYQDPCCPCQDYMQVEYH